jgi:CheY-like chemotaxis protein
MILIADDSKVAQIKLKEYLIPTGYPVVIVSNGREAWEILSRPDHEFLAVLLDRVMPEMDGMEVLKRVKSHKRLRNLPIIMQTSSSSKDEVTEGIEAGAYYYLTKPYTEHAVRMITNVAISDFLKHQSIERKVDTLGIETTLPIKNEYQFRKVEEVDILTTLLSKRCPDPQKVALGLYELLLNAVEHGNLGITYKEKSLLIESGEWTNEVEKRSSTPPYSEKSGTITFEKKEDKIIFHIKDEGNGFDWEQYLEISPERAFDSHGRGIAMSRHASFSSLNYLGKGNEVLASINL